MNRPKEIQPSICTATQLAIINIVALVTLAILIGSAFAYEGENQINTILFILILSVVTSSFNAFWIFKNFSTIFIYILHRIDGKNH